MAVFLQKFEYFCLSTQYTISVSQILQMAGTDIGDYTGIRSGNPCQPGHLSKITDSHFQHCQFILFPQAEHSQGQSQFIVKVSLCFQSAVFLAEYRSDHFLGAGLTYTSGNPNYRDLKLLQIEFRNVLYCLKGGFHHNVWKICTFQHMLRQCCQCSCFHHLRDKSVGIYSLSYNRHKQTTLICLSAVSNNRLHLFLHFVCRSIISASADLCNMFQS